MTVRKFLPIILCSLLFTFTFGGVHSEQLLLSTDRTIYSLSHAMISIDSISVPDGLNYISDPTNGRLILLQSPHNNDTIFVKYHYSEISAPKKRSLGIGQINEWFPSQESKSIGKTGESSSIKTRGSVSRKIEIGSSGQSLLSGGLDIRLNGELAPGVKINGVINDNDAPFDDYSSTQSVKDVDNVLIRIYSDKLDANIGDIYINPLWSYWSRFNRKLIGAQTAYKGERYSGEAFVGSARGKYIRQEITAREADQGPYRLHGNDGDNAIQIVPESEKIYIDGTLLERSQYTLYYSDAELYFSSELLIASSSRIVAEFNYVNEFFSRSSMGANSSWRFGKNVKISASYIREKDDENNPLDIHLANISSDSLSNISTTDGIFTISTALKDTSGDYDASGNTWVYVGEDQGSHTVYFYRENTNGGYIRQYTAEGKMFYTYAPEDPLSQYFPRRKITLPNTHWIASMNVELGQKNTAHALIDAAYSGYNENNYDSRQSQVSPAFKWDTALPIGKNLTISSDGWYMDQNYRSFMTITQPDMERYFGFSSLDTFIQNINLNAAFNNKDFDIQSAVEYLVNTQDEKRVRLNNKAKINIKDASISLKSSNLLKSVLLPYYSYELSTQVPLAKSLSFHASFLKDNFEPIFTSAKAYRAELFKSGVTLGIWSLDYTYRNDYNWSSADSSFLSYSRKHDASLKFDQGFFKNALRWNTTASYRYDQREAGAQQYILTNTQLNIYLKKPGIKASLKSAINRNSESKREAVFIFVGDGLGYYRLDEFGQYVPDEMGNFILSSELTNERRDQYVSKLSSSLKWKKQWKTLKLQFFHKASTDFRSEDLLLYHPLDLNDPDTSVFLGNIRLRHELLFSRPDGKHRFSILREDIQSQNFQTTYNENINIKTNTQIKYRFKPDKLTLNVYYLNEQQDRQRLPVGTYHVKTLSNGVGLECEYLFSKTLRASIDTKLEHIITDHESNFSTDWFQIKNDWIWYRIAGERLFISTTIDFVSSDHSGALPYETANGLPVGLSWSTAVRYEKRINQFLSAGSFLQYRKRAEQKAILTANVEVKAYF